MGNWIPNDPTLTAQILKISSAYTLPPPEEGHTSLRLHTVTSFLHRTLTGLCFSRRQGSGFGGGNIFRQRMASSGLPRAS
jgi:hypothetical protein